MEKGLTLAEPRRPFGQELSIRLATGLAAAPRGPFADYAESAADALVRWNDSGTVDPSVAEPRNAGGGWVPSTPATTSAEAVRTLFETRRSVRNFAEGQTVPLEAVREAVRLASNTPSVCNRQAWRVHFFDKPDDVAAILRLQNGNSGFAYVPSVSIVTVDLRLFSGAYERNQRWVDGGLFAMSYVWALHAEGLASCMLNWSMNNSASKKLRSVAGLEPWEDVISLVAIGQYPEHYRVARSPRRPVSEILEATGVRDTHRTQV